MTANPRGDDCKVQRSGYLNASHCSLPPPSPAFIDARVWAALCPIADRWMRLSNTLLNAELAGVCAAELARTYQRIIS